MTAEQDRFFTAMYLDRRKSLLEYAESNLHNHALAEEAVQQAFEIAWRKIDDFQSSPNPEGWIFNAVRFVVCNVLLSFGGLCVAMQTASAIGTLSIRPDLLGKAAQSLLTCCMVTAVLYHIPFLLLASAVFFCFLKKVVAKRTAIMYNGAITQRRNPYAVS